MNIFHFVAPIGGVLSIAYCLWMYSWIKKYDAGDEKMQKIASYIARGAIAFLKAEWRVLIVYGIIMAVVLAFIGASNPISHWTVSVSFLIGGFSSALAGYIGMKAATMANVRTAAGAINSIKEAFRRAFDGGSVMGSGVGGLVVLGLGLLFLIFWQIFAGESLAGSEPMQRALEVLAGFSMGAESIALFARVGGGIYTKAADVGADLVGKVEAGIPEDDPRNPAVIADNVGDNVGDVAGMGADLFGSFVATILAAMVLGNHVSSNDVMHGLAPIFLPLMIAAIGTLVSIICLKISSIDESNPQPERSFAFATWISIIVTAIISVILVHIVFRSKELRIGEYEFTTYGIIGCIFVGLAVGGLMTLITNYYTGIDKPPVRFIAEQSVTGPATNLLAGISIGMLSTFLSVLVMGLGILISYFLAGLYGIGIAAASMMATTSIQLSIDAFGSISDNAGGIAQMSGLPSHVRERTDRLDAAGNTTAAIGKGFAIASAGMTALALFAAFVSSSGISTIDIFKAPVLVSLLIGAMIPFLFSSFAIRAVGEAAWSMVQEVRRQFQTIPGIMEGKAEPDYEKCIQIATNAALRRMILPGLLGILPPFIIGFGWKWFFARYIDVSGAEVLGGYLAGVTVSGILLALFQCNAGAAWDNAKKLIEKGLTYKGKEYKKGSDPHKASVIGDTVGDPFKDTSGPSMNILIKLTSIVALIIGPIL